MSCHYPMCMMGGGRCPWRADCEKEEALLRAKITEQQQRDIDEQEARIAYYKAKTEALKQTSEGEK